MAETWKHGMKGKGNGKLQFARLYDSNESQANLSDSSVVIYNVICCVSLKEWTIS